MTGGTWLPRSPFQGAASQPSQSLPSPSQLSQSLPLPSQPSPVPRTVVVTGASAGIGAVAARRFAEMGDDVVVVGRSPERTAAVASGLGCPWYTADFTRLDEVRRLAKELADRCPRIDVLANNAGGVWPRRQITEDGYERTFQVNHLTPFLLTGMLLDRLRAAGPGRVVTTSSDAHRTGSLDVDNLDMGTGCYRSFRAYGATKLANILFTAELARREGGSVLATCFHPGVVATDFGRDSWAIRALYRGPARRYLRTPEQGADTLVWLATTPPGEVCNGGYYQDRRPVDPSRRGADADMAALLWRRSAQMVGLG